MCISNANLVVKTRASLERLIYRHTCIGIASDWFEIRDVCSLRNFVSHSYSASNVTHAFLMMYCVKILIPSFGDS